jgi:hypothetical protein
MKGLFVDYNTLAACLVFLYQTPLAQSNLCPLPPGIGNVLPGIEFNFYADPEASFIVFDSVKASDSTMNPILLFPWESVVKRNTISMVSCGIFICIVSVGHLWRVRIPPP